MLLLDLYLVMDDDECLYFTVNNGCYYYNFSECPEQYLNRQVKKIKCLQDNTELHVVLF